MTERTEGGRGADRPTPAELAEVLASSERLFTFAEIEAAVAAMAERINGRLAGRDPVVLCVMNGGLVTAGRLLPRLDFPLRLDYLHPTRYGGAEEGGELSWLARPRTPLAGETVLVVDDILDAGVTLAAIRDLCREAGAREIYSCVLIEKRIAASRPAAADDAALTVPDRFLFGYGLDYRGYLRNLPDIRALPDD